MTIGIPQAFSVSPAVTSETTVALLEQLDQSAWGERHCPFCVDASQGFLDTSTGVEIASCASCGFTFLSPCPNDADLFANDGSPVLHALAQAAGRRSLNERAELEQQRVPLLLGAIRSYRYGGWLLDIGASTGAFALGAKYAGFQVTAVEPSAVRREVATALGVSISPGDHRSNSLPQSSFAVVTLFGYLERVVDPVTALKSCKGLLAPNGLLFISTDVGRGVGGDIANESLAALAGLEVLSSFNARSLAAALTAAEFRIVDLYSPDGQTLLGIGEPT